jgi:hypothetical protein
MKTNKVKKLVFVAGADRHCCWFTALGDRLATESRDGSSATGATTTRSITGCSPTSAKPTPPGRSSATTSGR